MFPKRDLKTTYCVIRCGFGKITSLECSEIALTSRTSQRRHGKLDQSPTASLAAEVRSGCGGITGLPEAALIPRLEGDRAGTTADAAVSQPNRSQVLLLRPRGFFTPDAQVGQPLHV